MRPQLRLTWTWYAGKVNPGWKTRQRLCSHITALLEMFLEMFGACVRKGSRQSWGEKQSNNNLYRSYRQDSWLDEQTPIWCVPPGSPANTAHTKPSSETLCVLTRCETFPLIRFNVKTSAVWKSAVSYLLLHTVALTRAMWTCRFVSKDIKKSHNKVHISFPLT